MAQEKAGSPCTETPSRVILISGLRSTYSLRTASSSSSPSRMAVVMGDFLTNCSDFSAATNYSWKSTLLLFKRYVRYLSCAHHTDGRGNWSGDLCSFELKPLTCALLYAGGLLGGPSLPDQNHLLKYVINLDIIRDFFSATRAINLGDVSYCYWTGCRWQNKPVTTKTEVENSMNMSIWKVWVQIGFCGPYDYISGHSKGWLLCPYEPVDIHNGGYCVHNMWTCGHP